LQYNLSTKAVYLPYDLTPSCQMYYIIKYINNIYNIHIYIVIFEHVYNLYENIVRYRILTDRLFLILQIYKCQAEWFNE
jgi:hypothetical protein